MRVLEHRGAGLLAWSAYDQWARVSFLIYLVFIFFGTQKPFPDFKADPSDFTASNLVNQFLSLLFVVSMASLMGKLEQVRALIRTEKWLTALLAWSLLSVLWSDYPMVSAKRWVGLFGEIVICTAALLHFRWSDEALRYFRYVLFIYIPLSMLAVLFIHEATQWEFPAWRGLAPTKNNLGQVTLFSIILWTGIVSYHRGLAINALHYAMLGITIVLFLGARSTTSWLAGMVVVGLLGLIRATQWLKQPVLTRVYTSVMVVGALGIAGLIVFGAPEMLAAFLGLFGKDLTFTGRVELWQTVLAMTDGKWLAGWGIGGFWVMDSPHLRPLFDVFPWLPNQAHEGYIDQVSQTGFVGLGFLLAMIVSYFVRLQRLKKKQIWMWLMVCIVVMNFQESIFFRPRHTGHFMFVFAYLALHADLLKEKWKA